MEDEKIRSAGIVITQDIFWEIIGLGKYFDGHIDNIAIEPVNHNIVVRISGNDERMPEGDDYPLCHVVCKTVNSHFEKIKE